MKLQVVTSLCVDTDDEDRVVYPMLRDLSYRQRRLLYWQCNVVFFATAQRAMPHYRRVLYTNDTERVEDAQGRDLKQLLADLGTEVRLHKFAAFKPPKGFSRWFKNAFYKTEALSQISRDTEYSSILLDSDIVFAHQDAQLDAALLTLDQLLLYDPYVWGNDPEKQHLTRHRLSKAQIGQTFRQIDPEYPIAMPRVFGGELIGGTAASLQAAAQGLEQLFHTIVSRYTTEQELPLITAGQNIFYGMEYWTSMVYNLHTWADAAPYIQRFHTGPRFNDVRQLDTSVAMWHLPSEKDVGIHLLYTQVCNPKSDFWRTPQAQFRAYLAQYLGIALPNYHIARQRQLFAKFTRKTINWLWRGGKKKESS